MLPFGSRRTLLAPALVAALALSATSLAAQAAGGHAHHGADHGAPQEKAKAESHETSGWKELDDFHDVMSAAWHPAAKDSLGPARASATKLVDAARLFAKATAPKGCDTPASKAAVARLVPESEAVAALVARKAEDAAVKAALKTVHDTFHVAEDGCKPAKHEHD
jgi:hypothetical protein